MEARDAREMTYADYVALERAGQLKHEYVNGLVYAMAGGTPEHARLAQAIGAELRVALRARRFPRTCGCEWPQRVARPIQT